MVSQSREYLHKLFCNDVDMMRTLGLMKTNKNHNLLQISAIVRKLTIADSGLAFRIKNDFKTPLIIMLPEPASGNTPIEKLRKVPENVRNYAVELPPINGFYHKPYTLEEYLNKTDFVFTQPVKVSEIIKLLSNKLGGVHIDEHIKNDNNVEGETIYQINKGLSIDGERVLFNRFDSIAKLIHRSLAPLRDEIEEYYNGDITLKP